MKLIRVKPKISENILYLEDAAYIQDKIIVGLNEEDNWMSFVQQNMVEKYYFFTNPFIENKLDAHKVHYNTIGELMERNEKEMDFYIFDEIADLAKAILDNKWI